MLHVLFAVMIVHMPLVRLMAVITIVFVVGLFLGLLF
jgi:hypothetical protein